MFNARGIEAVNINMGFRNAHSEREIVSRADLIATARLLVRYGDAQGRARRRTMSSYARGRVVEVSGSGTGISEAVLEFEDGTGGRALVLEKVVGTVKPGDTVIANTTAVVLGLGSGGFHFVLWNLERGSLELPSTAT